MRETLLVVISFLAGFSLSCHPTADDALISIGQISVNYLENPVGVELAPLYFSWQMHSTGRNKLQTAFQILVAKSVQHLDQDLSHTWDSDKVSSSSNKQIKYDGELLESCMTYFWKVRVWDENDNASDWSSVGSWSTGLAHYDLKAAWISYVTDDYNLKDTLMMPGAAVFRKSFSLDRPVKRAMVCGSALGVYNLSINGQGIGQDVLMPGWTDYSKRVYYSTYEVTDIVSQGENVIGGLLADGWYSGYVGPRPLRRKKSRELYGPHPALWVQVIIEFEDGTSTIVATDDTWKATSGPIVQADILMGEIYDARRELDGWSEPGFSDSDWDKPLLNHDSIGQLQPYPGQPVRAFQELKVVSITEPEEGVYIFDFGQNFSGIVRLSTVGNSGDRIVLRHGEMLHNDGMLMTENLRFAQATDTYICRGTGEQEIWQPRFTYHGFRYVEVTGLKEDPGTDLLLGIAISASAPYDSRFVTSDSLINKLYRNIVWTQRSNFIDIPTDCPQRDERLGWLGDAQIFCQTALFNAQLNPFYKKWLTDVVDAQFDDGLFPVFAPKPYPEMKWIAPGWMEAGIIVPYFSYRFNDDKQLIRDQYASMTSFMNYHLDKVGEDYFYKEDSWYEANPRGGFGDWLELTEKHSAHDILSSFYFIYALDLMAEMSEAIGKDEDANKYESAGEKARIKLRAHYLDKEGKFVIDESKYQGVKGYFEPEKGFTGHTQSIYASAFYFDLLDSVTGRQAAQHLADLVLENGHRPSSGILGIRQVLPGLSKAGHGALAYKILRNKTYPSWGFEIEQGATTIWERWNSYTIEKGFNGPMNAKMNSFNHYAFGAVGEFLFNYMAGIQSAKAGFDEINIRPEIGDRSVKAVKGEFASVNGMIVSSWEIEDDHFTLEVEIPVNTRAEIYVPSAVDVSPTVKPPHVSQVGQEDGFYIYKVGSGQYTFQSRLPAILR